MSWPDKAVKWKKPRTGELKGLGSKSMIVKSYTHRGQHNSVNKWHGPNAGSR